MSRFLLLAALLVAAAAGAAGARRASAEPPPHVVLDGPAEVHELLRADVSGDGITDLLAVEGRTVWVWLGRRGALLEPTALRVVLPDDVSMVDVEGPGTLFLLGRAGARRLVLPKEAGGTPTVEALPELGAEPLAWADVVRASFGDLVRGNRLLLPTRRGWLVGTLGEVGPGVLLEVEAFRSVTAPGPFLEDATKVEDGLPEVVSGKPLPGADEAPSLWTLTGDRLVGQAGGRRVLYDVSFLPPTGERRLVDVDGDGVPDLIHGDGTNQEARVAFFRTPPPPADGEAGGSLKPALAYLQLTGYPLAPATADLNGDGRVDFVMTSIEIDTKNVVRALGGNVTAHTRAFLNRRPHGAEGVTERFFAIEPDAVLTSDIGVRIRFGYSGNLDIQRSFTIVVEGDYDGDGRKDLVIREGPDALRMRHGTKEGVWEREGHLVAIPPQGASPNVDGVPADLTGDGRDELVLTYRRPAGAAGERDRLVVLELR